MSMNENSMRDEWRREIDSLVRRVESIEERLNSGAATIGGISRAVSILEGTIKVHEDVRRDADVKIHERINKIKEHVDGEVKPMWIHSMPRWAQYIVLYLVINIMQALNFIPPGMNVLDLINSAKGF